MSGQDSSTTEAALEIRAVRSRADWKAFHGVPSLVSPGGAARVEGLALHQRQLWAPRHPYFRHARATAWLAWRDGRPVGRISAQIDALAADHGMAGIGHFGQLDGIDDAAVFDALLDAAGRWLAEQGMATMRGPFDLSINQQCGMLVDGFEHAPMMMMDWSPPWKSAHLERAGFAPAMDLLAYRGSPEFDLPARVQRLLDRLGDRIRVRALARSELDAHAETMRVLFNEAWAGNWGFLPMTSEEFRHAVSDMKLLVRPGYVQLAEVDGRAAGFIVTLPDLNEMIADLDGRLWPTGAVRLLWRIWRRRFSRVRTLLMGVAREHHRTPVGAALGYALIDATRPHLVADGVKLAEQSWILETNDGMRSMLESIGMEVAQRFRIVQRPAGPVGSA